MKTFDDYLDYLYGRGGSNGKPGLDKIRMLLDLLDNPQDKIQTIHIAGTNGKGSTAKMLASVLAKKYKCGIFTSPYMEEITEEISINGVDITKKDFMAYIDRIKVYVDRLDEEGHHVTYFEFITAIMFLYFYEEGVDVAVIEVGLGGIFDSTNVIKKPLACLITSISMDHTNILGDTLGEIASNKAGIIKEGVPVFVYPQKDEAMDVIRDVAGIKNAKLYILDKNDIEILKYDIAGNEFDFRDHHIKTSLRGRHQILNACLALLAIDGLKDKFSLSEQDLEDGIFEAYNPGRLELISEKPRILVDGSHNKESIDALVESLSKFSYDKLIIGFSVLGDKDHKYIIEKIGRLADKLVITFIDDNPRALDTESIRKEAEEFVKDIEILEKIEDAYAYTKSSAGEDDLIVWCGSLYLVGKILTINKADK
ncbi:bifunctional folylpolyglutamate synthase/dihydrofolate synthase [Anaerococcus kampingiae]|uniref:tetrahydrofolate synthase n=1 Tax=Anaerococcus kampingae TaxID=3115614 RepID=A0ABW9ME32_9FIRM